MSELRRFVRHARHPGTWLRDVCGGEAVYPLVILFGLNAVDELDRTAFAILLPEIRETFDLDLTTTLAFVAAVSIAALALQVPIAQLADRRPRLPLMIGGAVCWALFAGLTGLATTLWVLGIARSGSAVGKAVIDPTHNSLLADYYPLASRSRVYSTHRAANAVGAFVGPLVAGLLAYQFGWRLPFVVFVFPTLVFAFLALRLREPVRGRWEREAMGATADVVMTEETAAVVRRELAHRAADPDAAAGVGVTPVPRRQPRRVRRPRRAAVRPGVRPRRAGTRLRHGDRRTVPARRSRRRCEDRDEAVRRRLRGPDPVRLVGRAGCRRMLRVVRPVAEPRRRGRPQLRDLGTARRRGARHPHGLVVRDPAAGAGDGLLGRIAVDHPGAADPAARRVDRRRVVDPDRDAGDGPLVRGRCARAAQYPSDHRGDVAQVWRAAAARSEALYERRQGRSDLLLVRGLEAGYGGRTIIRGIDLDLREGEIVALLGTNGAGKSTLLKSISGVVEADRGAVVLDGRDITHAPPERDRQPRRRPTPRRGWRVRRAHGRREPRPRDVVTPQRTPPMSHRTRDPMGRRARSRCSQSWPGSWRPRPPTCPAASSRCSRWRCASRAGRGSCSSTSSHSDWPRWSWPRCSRSCATWPTTAWPSSSSSRA